MSKKRRRHKEAQIMAALGLAGIITQEGGGKMGSKARRKEKEIKRKKLRVKKAAREEKKVFCGNRVCGNSIFLKGETAVGFRIEAGKCFFKGSHIASKNLYEGEASTWNDVFGYFRSPLSNLIEDLEAEIKFLEESGEEDGENNSEQIGELRDLIKGRIEVGNRNMLVEEKNAGSEM